MSGETLITVVDPVTVARFWSKVEVGRPGVCWPWRAAVNDRGYGVFKVDGATVKAHRVAFELVMGQHAGASLRHSCDNPPCCNPGHLTPGTQGENVADMHDRERRTYASALTLADVARAKAWAAAGVTQSEIAAALGVSQPYVSMILAGHRGRSITKGNTHVG